MKILVRSDIHLEFSRFTVPVTAYDAVLLAGDISVPGTKAIRWARRESVFGTTVPIIYVPSTATS